MREMVKRIVLVIFVLLVLTAISGFFYMQKNPLDGKSSVNKASILSGNHSK
ncbi:hypothetical protein [Chryseobacterium carnipullorum]|uniref:Uncharacterized protein n=1 Tax=Chryseobacterium carnipullorum TaxID=1124835 RepID=A0A376DQK8_CHRCU|nr:hypothetical protein [Chryseobacterium carnipullorum]STC93441.1 Uncharacterised protein [Chryseobacterium carnipullorum]